MRLTWQKKASTGLCISLTIPPAVCRASTTLQEKLLGVAKEKKFVDEDKQLDFSGVDVL